MNTKDKYHRYLKSNWWKEIKEKNLKQKCEICFSKYSLLLHHFSYKDLYKPTLKKASRNTITVCNSCHHVIHTLQKERKLTYEQTKSIVDELKKEFKTAVKINEFYKHQLQERIRYD